MKVATLTEIITENNYSAWMCQVNAVHFGHCLRVDNTITPRVCASAVHLDRCLRVDNTIMNINPKQPAVKGHYIRGNIVTIFVHLGAQI